jgi:magnesium transporter
MNIEMRAFYKNNNGLIAVSEWFPIAGSMSNVQRKQKKYVLDELQIPEAFYNDIEDR